MESEFSRMILTLLEMSEKAYREYLSQGQTYVSSLPLFKINEVILEKLTNSLEHWIHDEDMQCLYYHLIGWTTQYTYEKQLIHNEESLTFNWVSWNFYPAYPKHLILKLREIKSD